MKKSSCILSLLLLFVSLLSCHNQNKSEYFLTKAQSYIEIHPDTAIIYLDSILIPEKFLDKEKYMEYLVIKVQAKYKNYDNIENDTNIFEAKTYFDQKSHNSKFTTQNRKIQMYAHLYSACVYDERSEYEKALKDYKTAFTLAENMQDSLYMWRINNYIGEVFSKQTYWIEALDIYKKSIDLANTDIEKADSYAGVSGIYYISNQIDSSLFYIQKAIEMVEHTENGKIQSQIYQNAHVVYKECNNTELAWKYLNMSVKVANTPSLEDLYNLNFLCFFIDEDADSTKLYVNKLRNNFEIINDKYLKASICDALTEYYASQNMYDSALYFQKELTYVADDIRKQNMEQNIYEVQKKYDYEIQRNIFHKKLNKHLIIICILIILLFVSFLSIIAITNSKRRERILSKQVYDLNYQKNNLEKFKQEINESFNNILKERFNIIRKVNIFERNSKTKQNIREIKEYAFGSQNKTAFEASVDVIESSYNKICLFIRETYPSLNETEYKVCLLSIVQISVEEIANIIGLGIDSVGKARTNIRKKLNIDNKKTSISEYILNEYYSKRQSISKHDL